MIKTLIRCRSIVVLACMASIVLPSLSEAGQTKTPNNPQKLTRVVDTTQTPRATRNDQEVKRYAQELQKKKGTKLIPAKEMIGHSLQEANKDLEEVNRVLGVGPRLLGDLASPWEMFAAALADQVQGTADWHGVQIVTLPVDAAWNDTKLGAYRAWRELGDSLPTWGPSYRGTLAQVSAGYQIFIENLDISPPDPVLRRQAEAARKEYDDRIDEVRKAVEKVGDHWADFDARQQHIPEDRRLPFDEWYRRFDGVKIAALQDKANLAAQQYTSLMIRAGAGYGFAANLLTDFNNSAFQGLALSPSGKRFSYRLYDISPDLGEFIERSKPLTTDKLTFGINKSSRRLSMTDTSWSGGASFGFGFFSFGANASGGSTTVDTSSSDFSMTFSAKNVDVFTILPGGWFNGTAVKALKDGPWIPNGPVAKGQIVLWGAKGVFNLVVNQIIVAYKPKIVARVSASEYSEIKTRFSTSGGFSIGPFGFGASYSRNTSDVKFDDASRTFTAEDTTDVPQIIAVVCSVLPEM